MAFELHPQLQADTVDVVDFSLCAVRLMNVAAAPWLILVPRRPELREIIDLNEDDQAKLWKEIAHASQVLRDAVNPAKLNVAALGNVVPQLHVHVIARFENDAAWPKPVWGNLPMAPYASEARDAFVADLRARFSA